jgi:hypothetical protein
VRDAILVDDPEAAGRALSLESLHRFACFGTPADGKPVCSLQKLRKALQNQAVDAGSIPGASTNSHSDRSAEKAGHFFACRIRSAARCRSGHNRA